jgi:hypothetical protein
MLIYKFLCEEASFIINKKILSPSSPLFAIRVLVFIDEVWKCRHCIAFTDLLRNS